MFVAVLPTREAGPNQVAAVAVAHLVLDPIQAAVEAEGPQDRQVPAVRVHHLA